MRNSWSIYIHDLKSLGRNWVAAVIIGGLIFLPSLYAWLNIFASWDPYANTDQLPVAIVNEDKGAEVRDEDINVGGKLVDTLKGNRSMDWHFTTRETAMEGIEYGDYFAVLIIPEDFSERLATVVSGNPQKSEIDYYVNEKLNSIAPKITEKGASVIVQNVSSEFVGTVNEVIFDQFNKLGIEIEKDLPDIERFEDYVFEIEEKLPGIYSTLVGTRGDAKEARQLVRKAQLALPGARQTVSEGLGTIDRTLGYLNTAEARLDEMAPSIRKDLETAQRISKEVNDFFKRAGSVQIDFTELDNAKTQVDAKMTDAIGKVGAVQEDLVWLKGFVDQDAAESEGPPADPARAERVQAAIERTADLKRLMEEAQRNARSLSDLLKGRQQQLEDAIADIQDISGNVSVKLDRFARDYSETIEPTIRAEVKRAKGTLQKGRTTLTEIQTALPEAERIVTSTSAHLADGQTSIDSALAKYPVIAEKIQVLADRIRAVQGETDINQIIALLRNNPEAERGFFEEPIVLNENKLFPIKNYGTGMTPFYTVLSTWVGCLLLISLLATEPHALQATPKEIYVGKFLTFASIGLAQTLIVTLGDLFILKVEVNNPAMFVLFGLFISLVFMTIVYTFVSLFGNIGKAMAIVMLVLQIAGSGGTYPVMLLPKFFQAINPGLPFTYAIDLMREAVGGIVWQRVRADLLFLVVTAVVVFLAGILFKDFINRKTQQTLEKSKESGLFH